MGIASFFVPSGRMLPDAAARKKAYAWLFSHLKGRLFLYILAGILSLTVVAALFVTPVAMGRIVDDVIVAGHKEKLLKYLVVLFAICLYKTGARVGSGYLYNLVAQAVSQEMRIDFYARLGESDFSYFDRNSAGDLVNRCAGDLDRTREFLAGTVRVAVENIAPLPIGIAMLFFYDAPLAAMLLAMGFPLAIVAIKMSVAVKSRYLAARKQSSILTAMTMENIEGNRVVRAFCREEYEIEKFERENALLSALNQEAAACNAKYEPVVQGLSMCFTLLVLVVGGLMVMRGKMSLGDLVVFNGSTWTIRQPVLALTSVLNGWQKFLVSAERALDIASYQPVIRSPQTPPPLPAKEGSVRFEGVTFRYAPDAAPALDDVSFSIEPGRFVGVVGPTGSGKSAILRLIMRFYEAQEGSVRLDGLSVRDYPIAELRSRVGVVMQDVFLFSETVSNNIRYVKPAATGEEAAFCADASCAADFVERMPEGYETILGERGAGLSGGQRQRLSLARTIMNADADLIILDNVTGALDVETENRVLARVREVFRGKTLIMITHRVASLAAADHILVMERGRVAASGTHDQLMNEPGYYRSAVLRQVESAAPVEGE